jgi:hypothetical protein
MTTTTLSDLSKLLPICADAIEIIADFAFPEAILVVTEIPEYVIEDGEDHFVTVERTTTFSVQYRPRNISLRRLRRRVKRAIKKDILEILEYGGKVKVYIHPSISPTITTGPMRKEDFEGGNTHDLPPRKDENGDVIGPPPDAFNLTMVMELSTESPKSVDELIDHIRGLHRPL